MTPSMKTMCGHACAVLLAGLMLCAGSTAFAKPSAPPKAVEPAEAPEAPDFEIADVAPIAPIAPVAPVGPREHPAPIGAPLAPLPPLPPFRSNSDGDSRQSTAELLVKGPVTVHINVISTDVVIVGGSGNRVKAHMSDGEAGVRLTAHGDRIDVTLDAGRGKGSWVAVDGDLRVELPAGSAVEVSSVSGDIHVSNIGKLRARLASGDLTLKGASGVEAQLVSGDVVLDDIHGEVRLRTVSGDAHINQSSGPSSQLEFGTTSGDLTWSGGCGSGCRIEARTMSGDVKLQPAASSSYEIAFASHAGDFNNAAKAQLLTDNKRDHGSDVRARQGKGEGLIECQTFSGDLTLSR